MGFTAIFGVIGSIFNGIFGWKQEQARTVQDAIKVLGEVTTSNSQREAAIAQIISAEASSGSWLAANWRPLFMCIFMGILISAWFGYTPPALNKDMPAMIARIFDIVEIGIMGYIPARSVEKIISQLNIGSVLKTLINKKLV